MNKKFDEFNEKLSENLLKKFATKVSLIEMYEIYDKNGIHRDRLLFFKEFILELSKRVYSTYLGKNYINTYDKAISHFDWCYNTTVNKYQTEGVDFSKNIELYNHFKDHFTISLYENTDIVNDVYLLEKMELSELNLWEVYLDYDNPNKSVSNIEIIIQLYNIFNKTIEEKLFL